MWKNSFYNTIGGVIRLALGLISVPFLTRTLGIEIYGLYATMNAITNIALFSEWSLSSVVTVFLSKEISEINKYNSSIYKAQTFSTSALFILIIALITSILLFLNASLFTSFFDSLELSQKVLLTRAVQLTSLIIGLRLIQQFFVGILQANKEYGHINIISTVYSIISIITTLYIAANGYSIVVIQYYQLFITIIMTIFYIGFCYYLKYVKIYSFTNINIKYFAQISKFGIQTWTASLGSTLFSQFDKLIVLKLFGTETSGIYSAITALTNQINSISALPVQPILPTISSINEATIDISNNVEKIFIKFSLINAFIICGIGSSLIIFSDLMTKVIFNKYALNIPNIKVYLIIISLAYSIYSFNAVGYFSLLATRYEQFVTNLVIASGILSLSLIYILSLKFGLIGACIGNLGYVLTLALNVKAIKVLKIDGVKYLKVLVSPILLTVIFSIVSLIFNNIFLSAVLYIIIIIILLHQLDRYTDVLKKIIITIKKIIKL